MHGARGLYAACVAVIATLPAVFTAAAHAQTCFDYTDAPRCIASRWWGGACASSEATLRGLTWLGEGDTLLFVADDTNDRLRVLDALDPERLVEIGGVDLGQEGQRYDIVARGRRAYAGGLQSLQVISLAEPTAPAVVRELLLPLGSHLATDGDLLLRLEDDSLRVLSLALPETPVTVGSLGLGECGYDVALADGVAYVGTGDGVVIVDLAVPSRPEIVARRAGLGDVHAVAIAAGRLFTSGYRLALFDLTDPVSPQLLGQLEGVGGDELAIDGGTVLATANFDFWLCDVATPAQPRLLVHGGSPNGAFTTGASLRDGLARMAFTEEYDGTVIETWRVGGQAAPAPLGVWPKPADLLASRYLEDVLGDGQLAYCLFANANDREIQESRLVVLDLGTAAQPVVMANIAIPYVGSGRLAKSGNLLLIQAGDLTVVDVSAPAGPVVLGTVRLLPPNNEQNWKELQVWGDHVLVGSGVQTPYGWSLVDIRDPGAPVLLGPLPAALQNGDLVRSGDVACVVRGDSLLTFDVTDPWRPVTLGAIAPGEEMSGPVLITGQVAYCSTWWPDPHGLIAIGIADPSAPLVLGRIPLPGSAQFKVAVGTRLYVGGQLDAVQVVDIADPTRLAVVGTVWPLTWNGTLDACEGGLLHADASDLRVLSLACASSLPVDLPTTDPAPSRSVALLAPHPNPFNPVVRIPFVLARPQRARVTVYDLGGRRVATLADETFGAGRQELVWRGLDAQGAAVASGSYLVRVEGELGRDGRRITLLK